MPVTVSLKPTIHRVGGTGDAAFANSWADRTAGSLFYWKDPSGTFATISAAYLNGASKTGNTVFTLPSGFRPLVATYGVGTGQVAAYNSAIQLEVVVGTDGTYQILTSAEGTPSAASVAYALVPTFVFPLVTVS